MGPAAAPALGLSPGAVGYFVTVVFVGSMMEGRTRATGHIQRITFNNGRPIQREPILTDLHQRIRDVRPGPDGFLYVLTDENPGAVLRVEPAN